MQLNINNIRNIRLKIVNYGYLHVLKNRRCVNKEKIIATNKLFKNIVHVIIIYVSTQPKNNNENDDLCKKKNVVSP
jgi:hypothetical protein